jgi:membrane-bound lytic murein transglycosylase D
METETESSLYNYRYLWLCLACFFLGTVSTLANPGNLSIDQQVDEIMEFAEEEVKARLQQLDQSLLEHRFDESVKRLIAYHLRHPKQTSRNLGRAIAYFPIFEAELAAAGVPESIKYLSVIESALLPRALSRVGAEGLWQFMPTTAPEYGLRIDEYVDERLDAHLATQAAIRYLKSAYDYLGDWSLALAAYNSGKGRVRRAQRRSGGKNFWAVRRHLPRETRNYVPAFIAAIYLTEFYTVHNIEPLFPGLDQQLVEKITVEVPLSFYRISQVTGLPVEFIQQLNPAYLQGYLPAYPGGHHLLLPQRVIPALNTYLQQYGHLSDEPVLAWAPILKTVDYQVEDELNYQQYTTLLAAGDSLESIAAQLHFTPSQLAIWNDISPLDSLVANQEISYYRPIRYTYLPQRSYEPSRWRAPLAPLPQQLFSDRDDTRKLPVNYRNRLHITLANKEKPSDFLARYPQLQTTTFIQQNQLQNDKPLSAGTNLVIERK